MSVTASSDLNVSVPAINWQSDDMKSRRKRRYAADRRLQAYGLVAIIFALGFLAILISSLIYTGNSAFTQSVEIAIQSRKLNPRLRQQSDGNVPPFAANYGSKHGPTYRVRMEARSHRENSVK